MSDIRLPWFLMRQDEASWSFEVTYSIVRQRFGAGLSQQIEPQCYRLRVLARELWRVTPLPKCGTALQSRRINRSSAVEE